MRVKKYLALTLAAILATTMLTACPWDQEEDETDDASSVPVTSTDTSQDDDDHDSGDDDSQPTKPSLTVGSETVTVGGGESNPISVNEDGKQTGTYTVELKQQGDSTLTMTIATQPEKNYVTNSVTADVDSTHVSWTRDTATRARTLSVRADTKLSLTTSDNGQTFTLTGIPADATSCSIDVTFADLGYVIENGTYKVHTAEGLKAFADEVNGGNRSLKCTLTADINLTEQSWTPIGSYSNRYTGTFDGEGHTISGLQLSSIGSNNVGLFGYVDGGTVKNLNLEITSVSGNDYVGGVVGRNDGTITGCMVSGGSVTASAEDAYVGGVEGNDYGGTITDCYWQKGPDLGVGSGGDGTTEVQDGNWSNVTLPEGFKLVDGKPVPSVIANRNSTPEVSGLTQRVLDVARAVGL